MFFCYHYAMNTITPKEAKELLDKGEVVSLDVRSVSEYGAGHIAGAQNVDFYGSTFEEEIKKLDRNAHYIVNCLSGGRSGKTVEMMKALGFKDAKNLVGGITAWKNEGLPVAIN